MDEKVRLLENINFHQLAAQHPSLDQFFVGSQYNFDTHEGLIELAQVILLEYFQLKVQLDKTRLCPRIPNRLKYLRLVGSLVEQFKLGDSPLILDIGTGHTCIYPLLGSRLTSWRFIGTDIDERSLECAKKVLEENNVSSERIQLKLVRSGDDPFMDIENCDVVMTNPPFYDETGIKQNKPEKPVLVGKPTELATEGGESQFIINMINHSVKYPGRNTVYSSLVGKYNSLEPVVGKLKELNITNYGLSEFSNKTKRWIVFWTFNKNRPSDNIRMIKRSTFNPEKHEIFIPLKNKINLVDFLSSIQRTTIERENEVIVFKTKGIVWSRKFRRTNGTNFLKEKGLGSIFRITELETKIKIHWCYGDDRAVFESLLGLITRKTQQSSGEPL
ncbi:hypothetical protein PP7435_CHR4-0990 [Komagataella phaffii CBS 7435]|uniref:U6 small nuclear RNA (adenine-(43)-N(6))-methyltransferase n=2 Tax=Komagataella phaffii TaxID=460519 RepID=C4R6M8_KOMPG|nr:Hypothetical protein PAS_chr4_0027 [Komagataella phaffii GS115]AOA64486.1 GQ67_04334T0 [Komagataella phaffii]CAH2451406.1 hypothetical protein BQ9382_C4-5185 [Komagataella phaffii CBS 7435]AOA69611.1 GQ68_04306T0 [Komagataella phaffii GS115]CAY71253.1 Hypothetical protein PAS_chr4_0027 [Komagataella phaffii GS115]SCV12435.1 hypothetical protein PP7435_CHR4-0990 [Komagataella phaffii CBS 7435]